MSRSPPPSRAATSTWRISLAKSLPRALSAAPFLCLIVAHLEWPDIDCCDLLRGTAAWSRASSVQLGMERRDDDTCPGGRSTGTAVVLGEHLDAGADALDERRPDEHGVERAVVEAGDVEVGLERVDLAAVARCAARRCRWRRSSAGRAGRRARRRRAGSSRRTCRTPACRRPRRSASGSNRPDDVEQHRHRGRLAAGHHQRVDRVELGGRAHLDGVDAERRAARSAWARERALQGEHADARPAPGGLRAVARHGGYQPRSASADVELVDLEAGHRRRRGRG